MSNTLNSNTIDSASFGTFNKTVDKSLAYIGDVLTYTIDFINTGNIVAKDVIFIDTLPVGVEFIKDSIVFDEAPQLGMKYSFEKGVSIGKFFPGDEGKMSYKVLVTTLPIGNEIKNHSDLSYKYRIQPTTETIPAYDTSNIVITQVTINYMVLNSIKYVDTEYAEVGETITYSLIYKNSGNTSANNVTLLDTLPKGVTFVTNSLKVNGKVNDMVNFDKSIVVGTLPVGVSTISFKVLVNTIPQINPIENIASSTYKYTVEPTLPNFYGGGLNTNKVYTQINHVFLSASKRVDKEYVDIGETLTYYINIETTGNISANKVILLDTISAGCSFINNSLKLNGITINSIYSNNQFFIGTLPTGLSTISYKVMVDTLANDNSFVSNGVIYYQYTVNPSKPNERSKSTNINNVETKVNTAIIKGNKYVDKKYANMGDTLKYSVEIVNTGNINANNVIIKDTIPYGVIFVENSITVGGVPLLKKDIINGINIGTIPVGITTVSFNVIVNTIPSTGVVENEGIIQYSYNVNPLIENYKHGEIRTNRVKTKINSVILKATQIVDRKFTDIGETLSYSIPIVNTGNTQANDVIIISTIPDATSYIETSTKVYGSAILDEVSYNNAQKELTVELGTIPIGTSTIAFKVLVETLPTLNSLISSAVISYKYTVDPSIPNEISSEIFTSEAVSQVNTALLNSKEKLNKDYADVGDTIVYTIVLNNIGNVDATNVVIVNTVPAGIIFKSAEAIANGIRYDLEELYLDNFIGNIPITTLPGGGIYLATIPLIDIPVGTTTVNINVEVVSIPSSGYATNAATIGFNYTVNPSFPDAYSNMIYTSEVSAKINSGKLESKNTVSSKFADIGDTLTYYTMLKNVGNVVVNNVIFRDTLPEGVDFIVGSFKQDGVSKPLVDPTNGFNITSIAPGVGTTVSFNVIINSMSNENPLVTSTITTYQYTVNPTLPNAITSASIGNLEKTKVNTVFLSASKMVDKENASVGDTLLYTIPIINTGSTVARNVLIQDTIPNHTTFKTNSLRVNEITVSGANIVSGFTIETLPIGTTTIDFKVNVVTIPSPNELSNKAKIMYKYDIDPFIPYSKSGEVITNVVNTNVYMVFINSKKTADKKFANIGETITYTLAINNTGNIIANDVILPDITTEGISFVENSLKINGVTIVGGEGVDGINIGSIDIGQATVSFDVKVTGIPSPNPIGGFYTIEYKYTVDPAYINGYSAKVKSSAEGVKINYINLSNAKKTVDKSFATCNDILTYTIEIPNSGNTDATNLVIADSIPQGTTYLADSLKVNGISINGNPNSIFIGTIPSGGVATVNFKVQVVCGGGIF